MVDLSTPFARLDYAAHLWLNYVGHAGFGYVRDLCAAKGISDEEIQDGATLGEARREAYQLLRRVHGDPAYGGGREWNFTANFDRKILERAADPGVSYCPPAPGVREVWTKAADVLRKYATTQPEPDLVMTGGSPVVNGRTTA